MEEEDAVEEAGEEAVEDAVEKAVKQSFFSRCHPRQSTDAKRGRESTKQSSLRVPAMPMLSTCTERKGREEMTNV